MENLIFEPVTRFMNAGNETQRCKTAYKGITIYWDTYFPWNIFKDPINIFTPDLVLPMKTVLKNGTMNPNYYTSDGYGMPDFQTLGDCIDFIENFKQG